jgi:ABC-type multidrug transport system fused ATPase/permease subunit
MASVILSMICALGVGLSYASGVTVMYPVMKIFVSAEGMQGWANRVSAQSRLGVDITDLDNAIKRGDPGLSVVSRDDKKVLPEIRTIPGFFVITNVVNAQGKTADARVTSERWKQMVDLIAHAPRNAKVTLEVRQVKPEDAAALPAQAPIQILQAAPPAPAAAAAPAPAAPAPAAAPPPARNIVVTLRDPSILGETLVWAADMLPHGNPMAALIAMVLFFIFLCFVGSAFRYYQQFLGMNVANRVIMDLRRRAYDRVVQLPTSYFARKGTSDAMSRMTQDTNTLTQGVAMAFGKAVQEPIKAFFAFGAALWIDWKLTAMIVVSVPFLAIIIRKFSKRMRRANRRALENSAGILAIINETLIGARVVKAYSAEGYERRRFARANKKLLHEQIKLNHYNALSRPTVETLAVILSAIPMLIAANWVLSGKIHAEAFLTILALFGAMLEPMRKLADVNARVQQTNAAAVRVFELVDMQPEPNISHALPKLPRHQRDIEFRDIVFSYPGHDEVVLNHVNVRVKAGQNVAVVGGNGSGKTTLLQLLPRLYVPTSGQILIDGIDTATVSIRSLRKQIGLVTQDTLLFADTIFNNIAYGTRHATREQVLDAARRAYADEFIRNLAEGYDTLVGEHGVRLSGGQKQRISIARAILHDPAILVLDEAMSQIDSDSEMKITLALREFTRNRTTFMIAHRFQSVISADLIVCLERGEVAGIGTHNQLLDTCLPYRRLYENQFHDTENLPPLVANGHSRQLASDAPGFPEIAAIPDA